MIIIEHLPNRAFLGLLVFLFLGIVLLLPAFLYSKRVKYKYYNGQTRRRIMARTHALPTKTERKQLASEQGDERKYQATSRARRWINEELTMNIEMLAEHHPNLLSKIETVVCGWD